MGLTRHDHLGSGTGSSPPPLHSPSKQIIFTSVAFIGGGNKLYPGREGVDTRA